MSTQPAFEFCTALVDALVSHGVTHAAVSPGSRNTPLLLALAANPGIEVSVHHDERSGGFFALGLAKASGRPTVLCCTSGTAATEYLPALTEARMAHAPLIALTADRPPELQDRGAPQTIDQTNLYGVAAKWFHDTGVPDRDSIGDARHLGRQAVTTSVEAPAGPVHINIPLREPLVPPEPLPAPVPRAAVAAPLPAVPRPTADEAEIRRIADAIAGRRTAIVTGATSAPDAAPAIAGLARSLEAIVIADPQSPARFAALGEPTLIATADLLVEAGFGDNHPPEIVLHLGAVHTSKAVNRWITELGVPLIHIDDGRWHDPLGIASSVVVADPAAAARELAKVVFPPESQFLGHWSGADTAADRALRPWLDVYSEPAIAHTVMNALPSESLLVAGSSMPIRLIDSYALQPERPHRVIANRGANGIDGAIATALGVAAAGQRPAFLLIGDLTALADVGSLAGVALSGAPLTIVVINNDGGGIFEYLPHADPSRIGSAEFTKLIRAPHGFQLAPIAASFGVASLSVEDLGELASLVANPGRAPRLIELRTAGDQGPAFRADAISIVAQATGAGR